MCSCRTRMHSCNNSSSSGCRMRSCACSWGMYQQTLHTAGETLLAKLA
jgi:hypothetical protein